MLDANQPWPGRSAAAVFARVANARDKDDALRHRDVVLSYGELSRRAGGMAAWLRAAGVGRGDVVATLLDRSPQVVAASLAAWAVGAAYVHIDPEEPPARVASLLGIAGARAVLTDAAHRAHLPAGSPPSALADALSPAPYEPCPDLEAADLAYLVMTSGSTGVAKAVAVEHRALLHYCAGLRDRIAPLTPQSFGVTTTFASDLGKTSIYGALLSGARLDVYDRHLVLDPEAMAAELRRYPVACLKYTPTQLEAIGKQGGLIDLLPTELLILGGEAFPPRLARTLLEIRPELTIFNHYGPSETTIGVLMHRVSAAASYRERVPVGRPLRGVKTRILGSDGAEVADGEPGVLHIAGPCLARGYLGDPQRTAEKFLAGDPRWYRTDDLAVRNQAGEIEYLGRADRQLKIRGHRVEPGEVEDALVSLAGVDQAVVVGERPGEDSPIELVAYVVARQHVRAEDMTRALRARLPAALVPSRIHRVSHVPQNRNGKIDLAALEAAALPEPARQAVGPRTATERLIGEIWCHVLGRATAALDDKFLDIGGDSFATLRVFGQLRRHYPDLAIAMLFKFPTIRTLAGALDGSTDDARPASSAHIVEV